MNLLNLFWQPGFRVKKSMAFIRKIDWTFPRSGTDEITNIACEFLQRNVVLNFRRWWQSFNILQTLKPGVLQNRFVTVNITAESTKRQGQRPVRKKKIYKKCAVITKFFFWLEGNNNPQLIECHNVLKIQHTNINSYILWRQELLSMNLPAEICIRFWRKVVKQSLKQLGSNLSITCNHNRVWPGIKSISHL